MTHAVTFLVLLATGILLLSATLRSRVVGGYSLSVRLIHCWTGIVFAFATLPFVPHVFRLDRKRLARAAGSAETWLSHWRCAHLLYTVVAAAGFTASGFVLWQQSRFSLQLMDASAAVHLWLTYVAGGALAAHLSVAVLAPALRAVRARYHRSNADPQPSSRAVKGAASCG